MLRGIASFEWCRNNKREHDPGLPRYRERVVKRRIRDIAINYAVQDVAFAQAAEREVELDAGSPSTTRSD